MLSSKIFLQPFYQTTLDDGDLDSSIVAHLFGLYKGYCNNFLLADLAGLVGG